MAAMVRHAFIIPLACVGVISSRRASRILESELDDLAQTEAFQKSAECDLDTLTFQKMQHIIREERIEAQKLLREERMEAHHLLREELREQSKALVTANKAALREVVDEVFGKEKMSRETDAEASLADKFHSTTEKFQILPLFDELIDKVNELQEARSEPLLGKADFFLGAKVQLQQYHAAIETIFEGSRGSVYTNGTRSRRNGLNAQSLFEMEQHGGIHSGIIYHRPPWHDWIRDAGAWTGDKIMQGLLWVKEKIGGAYEYYLAAEAYPLMEEARMQSGRHFADNLYHITMALVQQAWDLIPKAFTDWAPTFGGLTKILGYWIHERAKIAFSDRNEPLMKSLKDYLMGEYAAWLYRNSVGMIGSVLKAIKWWLCDLMDFLPSVLDVVAWLKDKVHKSFCEADWRWEMNVANQREKMERVREAHKTVGKWFPSGENWTANRFQEDIENGVVPGEDNQKVSKPGVIRRFVKRVVNGTVQKWTDFKGLVKRMVQAVFYPIFFSVAVPISHNMRMELSKGLVEFAINFMIEVVTKLPALGSIFGFIGDDASIPIMHKFGSARLLPIIYESDYMEDLEQTIQGAYRKWIIGYPQFRDHTSSWILRSYSTISDVKKFALSKDKPTDAVRTKDKEIHDQMQEKIIRQQKCARFIMPKDEDLNEDCHEDGPSV